MWPKAAAQQALGGPLELDGVILAVLLCLRAYSGRVLLLVCLGAVLHTSLCLSPNINIPPSSHSLTDPFLELSCFVVVAVVAILPLRPITPRLDKFTALLLLPPTPRRLPSLFF
jgi:hypothetical protein